MASLCFVLRTNPFGFNFTPPIPSFVDNSYCYCITPEGNVKKKRLQIARLRGIIVLSQPNHAEVVELVYTYDSKSYGARPVRVRLPPSAPLFLIAFFSWAFRNL